MGKLTNILTDLIDNIKHMSRPQLLFTIELQDTDSQFVVMAPSAVEALAKLQDAGWETDGAAYYVSDNGIVEVKSRSPFLQTW